MKTTLEIPHPIFRRAKSVAAEREIPFREFVTEAVKDKLVADAKIPCNDAWIAALCRQHSLPVLSRDQHFDHVPALRRIDW